MRILSMKDYRLSIVTFNPKVNLPMKLSGLLCLVAALLIASFSSAQASSKPAMDLIQTPSLKSAQQSVTYRTLFNVAEATDMMEMLKGKGNFTVFAPSDEAFGRLKPSQIRELLKPENKKTLKSLLSYHIVAGELTAPRILKAMCRGGGVARLTTIQGEELLASMQGTDIVLWDCSGNTARIINADSNRDNLIFHQIDSLVLPQAVSLP